MPGVRVISKRPMSEREVYEGQAIVRVRRNPWVMALSLSPLLLNFVFIAMAIATGKVASLVPCIHATLLGLFGALYAYRLNLWPSVAEAEVRADAKGLRVDSDLFVPVAAIKEAFVVPRPGEPPHVLIRRRGLQMPIELRVPDEGGGLRMLRALGFDASQTVARFRIMSRVKQQRGKVNALVVLTAMLSPALALVVTVMLAPAFVFLGRVLHVPGVQFLMLIPFLMMLALFSVPTHLLVGADGLLIKWLFWQRFIAHDQIQRVTRYDEGSSGKRYVGIDVVLHSGETIRLPVMQAAWDNGTVAMIHERVREAAHAWREGSAHTDASVLAQPHETTNAQWIPHLRALGMGALATHRTAPLLPDTLWRIVEDPSARPTERVAAAIALSGSIDDDGKGRLRVVAQATALPKLRAALDAVADETEDAALEASLNAMERAD